MSRSRWLTAALRATTVAAAGLCIAAHLPAQDADRPTFDERLAEENLKQAREAVDRARRTRDERLANRDAAVAPEAAARAAFERAKSEREIADRLARAMRDGTDDRPSSALRRLDRQIAGLEEEAARFRDRLRRNPRDAEAQRGLTANENLLERVRQRRQAQLDRESPARERSEAWRRAAFEAAERRFNEYWEAYGTWTRAANELRFRQTALDRDEVALAQAQADLSALEAATALQFANAPRPHLRNASARSGNATFYDATWITEDEVLDERIEFMRKAVRSQAREIGVQTERRDVALNLYVEASGEAVAAIEAYERAIWTQAYASIATELADSAITLALDAREGGTAGLAVGAGVELASRLYDWGSGEVARRYEMPASSADVPPSAHEVSTYGLEAGKDVIKDVIKATLRSFIEGTRAGAADYRRLVDAEPIIEELWVLMKRRVIFGNRVATETIAVVLRRTTVEITMRTARDRIRGALAALKDKMRQGLLSREMARNIGRSAAQAIVKTFLLELAQGNRLDAWADFTEKDAIALEYYRQLRQESNLRRFEEIQLEAYREYLRELLAERENARGTRRLRFDKDEALPASARGADGSATFDLTLDFTRDVRDARVRVNGRDVEGQVSGSRWTGRVTVPAGEASAQLSVEAHDALSLRGTDAQPHTVPSYDVASGRWTGWEEGFDNTHVVRLSDRRPGVSFVLLVDCSGSMNQQDRLQRAKAAAAAVLRPESFGPDDQVALWTFNESSAQLVEAFTSDTARVAAAVNGLRADGATPLALGIMRSGDYLLSAGRNNKKVLIVLSDGEETCNGNPFEAMRWVRARGAELREGVR